MDQRRDDTPRDQDDRYGPRDGALLLLVRLLARQAAAEALEISDASRLENSSGGNDEQGT